MTSQTAAAAGGAHPCGTVTFGLDPDEMTAVRARVQAEPGSTWHVLVAAGALPAGGLTGRTDAALMTIRAPQEHPTCYDTVGTFVDGLPLRVDPDGCATFRDVLLRTRGTCLEAYRHPLPNRELERHIPSSCCRTGNRKTYRPTTCAPSRRPRRSRSPAEPSGAPSARRSPSTEAAAASGACGNSPPAGS
jgi:hypothetical protein